ncbi:MAG: hypothetical protein BWY25_02179 [Chloroflexi bacterium ADurb.Bin222]|nr:MAG: hypothetical protein BWY25_02179 [Chloroflexi bacterium ADurb.Bin222]
MIAHRAPRQIQGLQSAHPFEHRRGYRASSRQRAADDRQVLALRTHRHHQPLRVHPEGPFRRKPLQHRLALSNGDRARRGIDAAGSVRFRHHRHGGQHLRDDGARTQPQAVQPQYLARQRHIAAGLHSGGAGHPHPSRVHIPAGIEPQPEQRRREQQDRQQHAPGNPECRGDRLNLVMTALDLPHHHRLRP